MDDEELPEGETVEFDPGEDTSDVQDTEDGGAIVTLDEDDGSKPGDSEFLANLAEELAEEELQKLSSSYIDLIGKDKEARKKRDEQYEEGIRRTGLGDDAPGGAQFQGASRVVHPMLTEVCVDFSSRAIKELFPPDGPVKTKIIGSMTEARVAKAGRKADFMNWQLTTQSQSFRAELEQLLTQVPLGGAQYMKVTWNEAKNRPEFLFVAIDEMLLPFAATNFYSAQRKTHVQYLTTLDYDQRVKSGMYRDVDIVITSSDLDPSKAAVANDKIEGREDDAFNADGLRTVYEIYTFLDIEDDTDGPAPYIITIDKSTGKVLSIYRNWDEDDAAREELQWIVEFPFVPWRGAYPIGIVHMIGGISAAATGALRALMDSAHINNSQTMIKLKSQMGGQSLNLQPTQVEEIEGGLNVDDVRKLAMPLPFNPPSAVLFQLLGFLVDSAKGVVRTTLDDVADTNANAPVGTTLAKIEQGMVVFNAIHARLHNSMERLMRIQHRLNGMYLEDAAEKAEIGEEIAVRKDFDGPLDIVPVSDPNIFSEAQRFAQVQAVAQRAQLVPQLYDARKVEQRILATLKIPDAESLLAPNTSPEEKNPIEENVLATLGQALQAFPEQDHVSHLKAHLAYMTSPALGASELIAPVFTPIMINHFKEHIALWYATEVKNLIKGFAGESYADLVKSTKTPEDKRAMDAALAEASMTVVSGAQEAFAVLPPIIKQAQEMMQKLTGPAQQDPSAAAAMADIQMRGQIAEKKLALDTQKLQLQGQEKQQAAQAHQAELQAAAQAEMQQEQLQQQAETQRVQMETQARLAMNTADNKTAMDLALLDLANGDTTPSAALNPNPSSQI